MGEHDMPCDSIFLAGVSLKGYKFTWGNLATNLLYERMIQGLTFKENKEIVR